MTMIKKRAPHFARPFLSLSAHTGAWARRSQRRSAWRSAGTECVAGWALGAVWTGRTPGRRTSRASGSSSGGRTGVPVAELPPAEPVPLCASAKVPESANAPASAIVASLLIDSLALLTKDNPPATAYVPRIFSAMQAARESVSRGRTCPPSRATRVRRYVRHRRVT